jgi:hypothetical protein
MAGLLATTALLWPAGRLYQTALALQVAFVVAAYIGFVAERLKRPSRVFSFPYYFILVNTAALHAFVKFLRRDRHRVWRPRLG